VGIDGYRYRLILGWGDAEICAKFGIIAAMATDANGRGYVADCRSLSGYGGRVDLYESV